jgi:hypothetical protein
MLVIGTHEPARLGGVAIGFVGIRRIASQQVMAGASLFT